MNPVAGRYRRLAFTVHSYPRIKKSMHFEQLTLTNFRGFSTTPDIRFAPLTFLVGPNSSGKSSLFDALLLVSQSGFSPSNLAASEPYWQGPLVDLGSFRDTVYKHDNNRNIHISLQIRPGTKDPQYFPHRNVKPGRVRLDLELTCSGRSDPVGRLKTLKLQDIASKQTLTYRHPSDDDEKTTVEFLGTSKALRLDVFSPTYYYRKWLEELVRGKASAQIKASGAIERIIYFCTTQSLTQFFGRMQRVSSGRLGPKRWYPTTGMPGPRTARKVYDAVEPQMLHEIRRRTDDEAKKEVAATRLRLGRVLKDLNIAKAITDAKLSPYHSAINVTDNITRVKSNLIDVGYGASQVIPVILASLQSNWAPLLVEQPEIHLHPCAQGRLAELLCLTSKSRQIVIETHSEHMINRARILVAQGKIRARDVVIQYVSRNKEGSQITTIPILANGDFGAEWPKGFFDERYEDTMRLLDIKRRLNRRDKHGRRRSG